MHYPSFSRSPLGLLDPARDMSATDEESEALEALREASVLHGLCPHLRRHVLAVQF
jgi:hypothetical protein